MKDGFRPKTRSYLQEQINISSLELKRQLKIEKVWIKIDNLDKNRNFKDKCPKRNIDTIIATMFRV